MNLEEFITSTLIDITKSIKGANEHLREQGAAYSFILGSDNNLRGIEFDVAVTVSENSSTEKGGSLKVAAIVGGEGGLKTANQNSGEEVSRIRFVVETRRTDSLSEARRQSGV